MSIGKWFMANWAWFVVGLLPLVALPMLFGDAGWEALGSPWFQVFFAVVMIISIRAGWMFLPVIFTSIFLFMVFVNSTPQKTTEWARWLFSSTKDTVVEGASNDYATGKKVLGALQVGAGVDKTPTDWKNLPVQVNPQVTVTHDIRPSYSPDFNRAREWINTPYAPYKGVEVIGGEKPTPPPKPMAEAKPKPTTPAKPSWTEYKTIKPERYRYTDGVVPLEDTDCVMSMGGVDLEAGHPANSRVPAYKKWVAVARYKEIHHWGDRVSVFPMKSLPEPGEQPHPNPTLHVAKGGCPSSPS
ncbi:MAG TPA: hypothetical protein VD967_03325 [Candidatus Paceibacterota bacterium]|nr:hypothetical protein [Candidatus Paceibacterota bacterium]